MEVCSICFESLEDDKIHTTKCSHSYHKECLEKWLNRNNTCPICRTKIKEIDNIRNRETYTDEAIMGVFFSANTYIYRIPRNETHFNVAEQRVEINSLIVEETNIQTGINEADIRTIICQTHCTREEAITSLMNNNYDILDAIMEIIT
jgi:NACalpha-BTF3-like transcription factor